MRLEADRGSGDGRQRLEAPVRLVPAMRGHGPCQLTQLMTRPSRVRVRGADVIFLTATKTLFFIHSNTNLMKKKFRFITF